MTKVAYLSFVSALGWIIGSAFLVSGSYYKGYYTYQQWQYEKRHSPKYWISTIVQTGPQKEALKTEYLAELMDLAADFPTSAYLFNPKIAEDKMLSSPVIKTAKIKVRFPSTVYIDYTVRNPVAWLSDYHNIAVDLEGVPFPVTPYFSPKNLPEIYLGSSFPQIQWHLPLMGKHISLAFTLLNLLNDPSYREAFRLKRIDVSNAYAPTYGKREIVIITEDDLLISEKEKETVRHFTRYLRLSTKNYAQELGNYLKLRQKLIEQEKEDGLVKDGGKKMIDLRLPQLAFIEERE